MNIIESVQDPKIFGPLFPDLTTWRNWMAVIKWIYGLECDDYDLELFIKLTGRDVLNPEGYQNIILVMGRRSGKTRIVSLMMLFEALFTELQRHRAPGEMIWCHALAVDKMQAANLLNYVAAGIELFPGIVKAQDSESITLKTGVAIGVKAASQRGVRSYTTGFLACDEAAWWRDESGTANPLDEILVALQPGLVAGGRTVLISSPWAKSGSFYGMFRDAFGNDEDDVTLAVQAASSLMNPTLDTRSLVKRFLRKTAFAENEYSGQFRSDIQNLFSEAIVDAAMDREACPPNPRLPYVAFVDAAGGSGRDSYAMAIAVKASDTGAINVCRLEEREPPFDPVQVTAEFAAILKLYGLRSCTGDRFAGQFPVSAFMTHGVRLDICKENKSELYRQLAALMNSRRVHLPKDDERLKAQLISLEASGRDSKVDAPRPLHEDRANACAGAVALANETTTLTEAEIQSRMPQSSGHLSPRGTLLADEQAKADLRRDNDTIMDDFMRSRGCTRADPFRNFRRW